MAKLKAYYGLCPLIDHRSLLGISEDKESGVVIVTLGKNIASKYKLSDQKQICSWRTKDKFSAPIIYDGEQSKYVAVFNESFIRTWEGSEEFTNEEYLDKLKKFKFKELIYTIFSCNNGSFVVFKNGAVKPLMSAIEYRKDLVTDKILEQESAYITEVLYMTSNTDTYVGLIVTSNEENFLYWTKFTESCVQDKFSKITLSRNDAHLSGYVFHGAGQIVHFLSLWSDGRIYSAELRDSDLVSNNVGDLFAVVEAISCKEFVSMVTLDQNYIGLYGCNSDEEGALLIIYNVQFKVTQSRQTLKLYTNGAKLWRIENNLLFPVGQNLAVVPFHLDMEQLAALVGSHKVTPLDPDADVVIVQKLQFVEWNKSAEPMDWSNPDAIYPKMQELLDQGLSENQIFEELVADLKSRKDVKMLGSFLQYFTDIPEKSLVAVLKFVLNLKTQQFKKGVQNNVKGFPQSLQPRERSDLIDSILCKSFNDSLILPHVRSILTLDEVLTLLQYIRFLLSESGPCLPSHNCMETEAKLIHWTSILLDANYQKLLLTKDSKIRDLFLDMKEILNKELSCDDDMKYVASLLNELKRGKPIQKTIHMAVADYTIEEFPLYSI